MTVILHLAEQTPLPQTFDDGLSGILAGHPLELGAVRADRTVRVQDVDGIQAEPAADLEVVGVVGRGDLEDAGTERWVDVVVGEDLYLALDEGHEHPAADEVLVALVVGVDDEGDVAEHGLRAGRE